ncbi:outer membrane protein assembly factor BamE [Sphingomonas rhizophila]|uniref:Outer membrane protein assembly factor BamE n=1 Tax=Sphingomonas rhizophila TaxID=2071607 RepID=A0A7G9SAP2_9SPHN|nr:outer membrane protein assembly factor BamE [Sphingomonas rhizophila]QNN64917.1 outer membrane protein assembly factor BamE [Sphingomonas rhizophila]
MTMRVAKLAVAFLGLASLSACVSIKESHGFVADEQLTQAIQPGIDNKDSVSKSLGRPTFVGQFSPNDWYYVTQQTRRFAFRNPRTVDATILHVSFDQAGNVAAVQTTDESQIVAVNPMGGKTPTLGHKKGLLEELFGNISSISQPGLPGADTQ